MMQNIFDAVGFVSKKRQDEYTFYFNLYNSNVDHCVVANNSYCMLMYIKSIGVLVLFEDVSVVDFVVHVNKGREVFEYISEYDSAHLLDRDKVSLLLSKIYKAV